jgi:multisubunit Na+/H+ antiporter MnhE subunit
VSAGRLAWVLLLTGVYLLSLGSMDPLDAAEGLVLATVLSLGLRGRLERPQGAGPSLVGRIAAFPLLVGGLLIDVLRGTWDVALRVLGLRPVECPGIVLVPIGERTELGVAVTGLLAGLSPGSMLVEVDPQRQAMLFHVIDAHDPDTVRDHLDRFYRRYQRRVFP